MQGRTLSAAVVGLMLALGHPCSARETASSSASLSTPRPEVTQWLRLHPEAAAALERLSQGARQRFLRGLMVRDGAVVGFDPSELSAELDAQDSQAFLASFGLQEYAGMIHSHHNQPGALRRIARGSQPSELEGRFDAFVAAVSEHPRGESDSAFGERVGAAFDRLFPEARSGEMLAAFDDHDLWLVFRAADDAAGIGPTEARANVLERVFAVLHAHGLAMDQDHVDVQQRLVAARLYARARAFTVAHPEAGLATIPKVLDDVGSTASIPTLLRQEGTAWRREGIDLRKPQVLVLSGCHNAEVAARDIAADPILGPAFARHARWLALPPGEEDFEQVAEWNRSHAPQRMEMVYDRAEWTLFDRWLMPTFIVLRDRHEIERFSGWPPEEASERKARLIAALRRAGLLEGNAGR